MESAFFFTWWEEQDEETRTAVQELVNSGRLEFVGGAWSMNDEAATHYQSTIDQFSWGLRFFKQFVYFFFRMYKHKLKQNNFLGD